MKLNLKPLLIKCPDCPAQFLEWSMLFLHWRKANSDFDRFKGTPDARRYPVHFRPRDRNAKLTG